MTSLNEQINEIKTHLLVAESELNSLISGKKASSSRVRKSLQEVKKLSHLLRRSIVEFTKSLPTKKRTAIVAEEPAQASVVVEEPPVVVEAPKKKEVKKRARKEQAP